ncbi:MAG: DUF421 domain-containing protein [Firmicutes bacterium]|nr:DUF421 domain-containing protein [Bacillota bacterium]
MTNTTDYMLVVFFKGVIIFIFVLFVMRLMGKRELGEMQPFELVITIIIAEVACIPMNDPGIPIYFGLIPIITLVVLHFIISFLSRKSHKMRKFFSGSSMIVLDKDGINYKNLKALNMTVADLIEAVRSKDYADFNQLQYVIFETNGSVSIIPKKDAEENATDFLPIPLILDGKYIDENIAKAEVTKPQLTKKFNQMGLHRLKDVLLCDIRQDGSMYVQPKNKRYIQTKLAISGGGNW